MVAQAARFSAAARVLVSMSTEKLPAPLAVSVMPGSVREAANGVEAAIGGRHDAARLAHGLPLLEKRNGQKCGVALDQPLQSETAGQGEIAGARLQRCA